MFLDTFYTLVTLSSSSVLISESQASHSELLVKAVSEIVTELIKSDKLGQDIDLNKCVLCHTLPTTTTPM